MYLSHVYRRRDIWHYVHVFIARCIARSTASMARKSLWHDLSTVPPIYRGMYLSHDVVIARWIYRMMHLSRGQGLQAVLSMIDIVALQRAPRDLTRQPKTPTKPSPVATAAHAKATGRVGIRVAVSTAPDISGSGRVDMPTRPVAAT